MACLLTFVKDIAHWAVVQYHYFAEIRLNSTQILDICTIPERAMLAVISTHKVGSFALKPVDHWIGILLHTSSEDNKFEPLADL